MTRHQQYAAARTSALLIAVTMASGATMYLWPFIAFTLCLTGDSGASICYTNLATHQVWQELTPEHLIVTMMGALVGIRIAQDAMLLRLPSDNAEPEPLAERSVQRICAGIVLYHLGIVLTMIAGMLCAYSYAIKTEVWGAGSLIWFSIASTAFYTAYRNKPVVRALNNWHVRYVPLVIAKPHDR